MSEKKIVGVVQQEPGDMTEPRYSFSLSFDERCVVTEMYADWGPSVSDAAILAFLQSGPRRFPLPPPPNYQMYYGLNASGVSPLMNIFDLKNPRMRFTIPNFDPIQMAMPIPFAGDAFQVILEGTPIRVDCKFELTFSIITRPFNS